MSFISGSFSYNGISSTNMGVTLVHFDTGMLERPFSVQKTINSEKVRYRDVPIYYNVERTVYNLPISIAKIDPNDKVWTIEERMKISQWLMPGDDQYHDFVSDDYDLLFPLQFVKGTNFDNYSNEGYVTFDTLMGSPYPYTIPSESYYDLSDNTTTTIIEIENRSNVLDYYYPIFQFELVGDSTTFKIKNLTVNGEETTFSNLTALDKVNIDGLTQRIESSSGNNYIDNFNFNFLRLAYGKNRLEITGKCYLTLKCTFPIMI